MRKLKTRLHRILFSFPVQLLLVELKKNQGQLVYWLLIYAIVSGALFTRYGLHYLFVDPEYMGNVGALAFFIVGISFGTFVMAFNISSYLLNAHRFPFLATLSATFYKYCLNNFILPTLFFLIYLIRIVSFQYFDELRSLGQVLFNVTGFFAGYTIMVLFVFRFFKVVNKDIFKLHKLETADSLMQGKPLTYSFKQGKRNYESSDHPHSWHVEVYIAAFNRVRIVRDVSHYPVTMLTSVFKQNHRNAAIFQIALFVVFCSLGLLSDFSVFKIPAAASLLLLFAMFIMIAGVVRFWLRGWATLVMILFFLFLNHITQYPFFNTTSKAYGLNYHTKPAVYNLQTLAASADSALCKGALDTTHQILNAWLHKQQQVKPKLVLLNVSGGGSRSMLFSYKALTVIDSALNGSLMQKTAMITGSSGGMIAATYYRQQYAENNYLPLNRNQVTDGINAVSKDLLNGIAFKLTVSDLFFNSQRVKDANYSYVKDRGTAWEKQMTDNMPLLSNKRLVDFKSMEYQAKVPLIIYTPTIINDGRALFIASQPVTYLIQAPKTTFGSDATIVNGVELTSFFAAQDALNIKISSVLRLNSTFPYVSPVVSLPAVPPVEVMDSGIRDNFGLTTSARFIMVCKDWIEQNTSGVVVLQIRDTYKKSAIQQSGAPTYMQKLTAPFRNLSGNFLLMQDYSNDALMAMVQSTLQVPVSLINFELPDSEQKVSLSWHLTKREKIFTTSQMYNSSNQYQLQHLLLQLK